MIAAPAIVPSLARPLPVAAWAPRVLVVECLATGAPLAAVARMLGLRSVDELLPVLARHGLQRCVTNGVVVVAGTRAAT